MQGIKYRCENTPTQGKHTPIIYYCKTCHISMCSNCMIAHLFVPHESTDQIKQIEEVFEDSKKSVGKLSEELAQSYKASKMKSYSKYNFKELISQKKTSINQSLNEAIEILKKTSNQMNSYLDGLLKEIEVKLCTFDKNESDTEYNALIAKLNDLIKKFNQNGDGSTLIGEYYTEVKKIKDFTNSLVNSNSAIENSIEVSSYFKEIERTLYSLKTDLFVTKANEAYQQLDDIMKKRLDNVVKDDRKNIESPQKKDEGKYFNNSSLPSFSNSPLYKMAPINPPMFSSKKVLESPSSNKASFAKAADNNNYCPYQSMFLLSFQSGDDKNNLLVYQPNSKKVQSIEIKYEHFKNDCYSKYFPYKHSKYTNIGKNSIIVSGGFAGNTETQKVFKISLNSFNLQPEITALKSMKVNRQNHNNIYIPSKNYLFVCSGQNNTTSEYLDLALPTNQWIEIPKMNQSRANATMAVINERYVFCFGGYNHQTEAYAKGAEKIDLSAMNNGWKEINLISDIALSTMGVLTFTKNQILLVGGFKGGKKYLSDGILLTFGNDDYLKSSEKKENILKKGVIFFSSQQFFKCGDRLVNFDFKNNLYSYDEKTGNVELMPDMKAPK